MRPVKTWFLGRARHRHKREGLAWKTLELSGSWGPGQKIWEGDFFPGCPVQNTILQMGLAALERDKLPVVPNESPVSCLFQ